MKLVIAGGGTGGHIFSGIAVAEEWVSRGGDVVFVGTKKGLETSIVPQYGFKLELVPVASLKGLSLRNKIKTLAGLPWSLVKSVLLLRQCRAETVLGIGGYASGPVVLVGRMMGLATAVIDQNSVPGFTNRILGKWVDRVFLNFDSAAGYFRKEKVVVSGNPVIKSRQYKGDFLKKDGPVLLVCGGSQGAHVLNEKIVEAHDELRQAVPGLKIFHQTGRDDFEHVDRAMREKGIGGKAAPFFDDMEKKYAEATLAVSRAGAGALTEFAMWGLPSILVPYPHAADNHQQKNALEFSKNGAACVILQNDLEKNILAQKIVSLFKNKERLEAMSKEARKMARPDSARVIVDELIKFSCTKN